MKCSLSCTGQTTYKVPSFPFCASHSLFSLHFMISPSSFSASQSWFSLHLMSSPPSCSASQSWFSLRFMSSFPSFSGVPIVHYLRFHFFALLVPRGDVLYDFRVFMIFLYLCTYIQVSNTISCRLSVIQWVTPVEQELLLIRGTWDKHRF